MKPNICGNLNIPVTNNYRLALNDEEKGELVVKLTSKQIKELGSNDVAMNYTNLFVNPKTSTYSISLMSEDKTQGEIVDVQLAGMGEGDFTDLSATPLDTNAKNSIQPRRYKIYTQNAEGKIELSYQNVYFVIGEDNGLTIARKLGDNNKNYFNANIYNDILNLINIPHSSIDYSKMLKIVYKNIDDVYEYGKQRLRDNFYFDIPVSITYNDDIVFEDDVTVDMTHNYKNAETMLLKDNTKDTLVYDVLDVFVCQGAYYETFLVNLDLKSKLSIDTVSVEVTDEEQEMIKNCLLENYVPVTVSGLTWDNYNIHVRAKADTEYNEVGKGIVIDIQDKSAGVTWKLVDSIDDIKYAE